MFCIVEMSGKNRRSWWVAISGPENVERWPRVGFIIYPAVPDDHVVRNIPSILNVPDQQY